MNLFDATIMGIVEGATEFLPISSTGHLIVAGSLLGVHDERGKVFEIAIQIGAIFAVIWAYRERFNGAIKGVTRVSNAQRFVWNLFVAFLPVAVLGLLLNKYIKAVLFNPYGVAAASIIGALVIFWVERPSMLADRAVNARVRDVDDMTALDAIKVGFAQCFGLIPGMSRSGSTLIGGMLFGLSRNVATEFSFFLGVPTLAAASVYSLWKERALLSSADIPVFAVGMVVSFIVALVVIRWLIRFVATHSLRVFAWYRLAFGALILAAGALGWVQWPAA
ncbi:undecaprenyl-diphosphate phosphatase [Casimicrobium huifangae]|uniref:undecaprenyl-diphosphate phosphatase n=1 Tax=Casimicrobium huifangae TaxID=2591109 RepID=UPI002357E92C|nr:undecaprenyl-diphosphate phosphatase [Casimicrobium huifangae]HOB01325.1 undecaprenyl-diphosphate phosphatase [Casimicrobium huifangae]